MTLRHSLAQGDLLGTTGLVASSGPAAQNLCHLTFWETGGIFPVQSQTQENSSAGAGLALLMAQSKPVEVEAPEGCLRDGETPPGMGGTPLTPWRSPCQTKPELRGGTAARPRRWAELIKLPAPGASPALCPSWVNLQLRQLPTALQGDRGHRHVWLSHLPLEETPH